MLSGGIIRAGPRRDRSAGAGAGAGAGREVNRGAAQIREEKRGRLCCSGEEAGDSDDSAAAPNASVNTNAKKQNKSNLWFILGSKITSDRCE